MENVLDCSVRLDDGLRLIVGRKVVLLTPAQGFDLARRLVALSAMRLSHDIGEIEAATAACVRQRGELQ